MSTIFYVSYGAMWLLLIVLGVLLLLVYRHFGIVALGTLEGVQRDGLAIGEPAPVISGVTPDGVGVQWAPHRDQPELLTFVAPDCAACAHVLPYISHLAGAMNGYSIPATAIVTGPQANAVKVKEKFNPPFSCIAEDGSGAFERYRVRVTPFAFVIGGDGRILAKGLCSDAAHLRGLLLGGGLNDAAVGLESVMTPATRIPKEPARIQEASSWH